MQKNKKFGLTSLEVLLSTIVILLIGAVSYLAYQNYIKLAPAIDKEDAVTMVTNFYAKYYESVKNSSDNRLIVSQFGTTNFINSFNNTDFMKDPVLCAQTIAENSPTVKSYSLAGSVASVILETKYDTKNVTMNVSVVNQNGLKVDSVTCPAS